MNSTSETGHAKNISAFESLISFCNGFGAAYNPGKASLQLPQLQALLSTTRTNLDNVNASNVAYNNAVNTRAAAFANLNKLATRLVNALEASSASKQTIDDAVSANKKLQGTRSSKKPAQADAGRVVNPNTPIDTTTPPPTASVISSSQQSYDQVIEHFSRLINILATEPTYNPNEADLQVAALNALLTNLKNNNTGVINAYTTVTNSRIARNKSLYQPDTGLCAIAQNVKSYTKSAFGATSPEHKTVNALRFKTVKL